MLTLDVGGGASKGGDGPDIARRDCHCETRDVGVAPSGRREKDEDAVSGESIDRHSD